MRSNTHPKARKLGARLLLSLMFLLVANSSGAQCNNWSISAQLITSSTCAANGSFAVTVSGPDAANLSSIQYGIPLSANNFSVPLNNSSIFNNIPPESYTVSAVANCGGSIVGKNTSIDIPGNYVSPAMYANLGRRSLTCGNYGAINISIGNGRAPYSIVITSAPTGYAGSLNITTSNFSYTLSSLPAGNYTMHLTDACGSGTVPVTVSVPFLNAGDILSALEYPDVVSSGCNALKVIKPLIPNTNVQLWPYYYDTLYKLSVQIGGGVSTATPFVNLFDTSVTVPLLAGYSIKDCYGKTLTYTIKPPCGPNLVVVNTIPYPSMQYTVTQNCNVDFVGHLSFRGAICFPVTYTLLNTVTSVSYGPFTATGALADTPPIPVGSYVLSFTTGDGFTGVSNVATAPVIGNPYSVAIMNGAMGFQNYIEGFRFFSSIPPASATVELFNGPAGYSSVTNWAGGNTFLVLNNQTPTVTGTSFFPAGNYVWKITDNCGTYYLPITVGPQHLFQFTEFIVSQKQTCQGLWVWPGGTATNDGQPTTVRFSVLKNGSRLFTPGTNVWPQFAAGDSFLITAPGVYTIIASAINASPANPVLFLGGGYPNPYTTSYSFTYTLHPLQVDINATQGFICKGSVPGQGQIYVKGKDGMPYSSASAPYKYYLALQGFGLSGPFIANNTTGIFTNFGGNANAMFDVRVVDSCGAFAVQTIKIIDLETARLISSSNYVACQYNDVQLSAIYLPNATYSWTGPNGFTSSLREPVITNIGPLNIGVYHVAISTANCSQTVVDSTIVTMAGNPPKPLLSIDCAPPAGVTVTNPMTGIDYSWDVYIFNFSINLPSDIGYTKYFDFPGVYNAVALDTTTGCKTYSDTVRYGNPNNPLVATIYSPHLNLCSGDTTLLLAQGALFSGTYQWFKNGVPLSGATSNVYVTNVPGNYKVSIFEGVCQADTSAEVTVTVVPIPTASISAPVQTICGGDTAFLSANTATGYSYTWYFNSTTVPGATSSVCPATQAGSYYVTISNGGCVATSTPVTITVNPAPLVNILPATDQLICPGTTVSFSTIPDPSYSYAWKLNGIAIPGANTSTFTAGAAGVYTVSVATAACPNISSPPVALSFLPVVVDLGHDTVVCNTLPFTIPLSVPASFAQILWSTSETTPQINVTAPGSYWVNATNICGSFSDTFRIGIITDYLPSLPDDTTICNFNFSMILGVPAGLQNIMWSTGATASAISINQAGIYWVSGLSPCGILRDTMNVSFCKPVINNVELSKSTICEGDCINPVATVSNYPQSFTWTFAGANPASSAQPVPGNVCYALAGTYPVTLVISSIGGRDTFTTQVEVLTKPKPRFKDTLVTVPYKSNVLFPACAGARIIDWYKDGVLVCSNCPNLEIEAKDFTATYYCVVRNGDCIDSCSYRLRVVDIPHDVWLPDAFSPNGDGRNDIFRIITDNPNIQVLDLLVVDRFGEAVFESGRSNKGWDGTFRGLPAQIGSYFWLLKYKVAGSDEEYMKKGDLGLIR